jgi:phosphatidylinositol alpha-1,6-mannosyltransferase
MSWHGTRVAASPVATTPRTFMLTPSRGRGGGIERYAETLEGAFSREGVEYQRLDLPRSGAAAHRGILADLLAYLRFGDRAARLVVVHPRLLPVAVLAASRADVDGISVVCHGRDAWGSPFRPYQQLERALMRRNDVRVVAVSSFTAGALLSTATATILPPGVTQQWFDTLVSASAQPRPDRPYIRLVTVFRLADWRDKGLPQLLEAMRSLGRRDVMLTVLGVGDAPVALLRLVNCYENCVLRSGLTDGELAGALASADLLVLATRTRTGRHPYGEGFGLVLVEAQLAGTPVVAPAHGGSHDAFAAQVTGMAPADESAAALADVLDQLLRDPSQLAQMGRQAAEWARARFNPDRYAPLAAARLL